MLTEVVWAVSKTAGCRFDSCPTCQRKPSPILGLRPCRNGRGASFWPDYISSYINCGHSHWLQRKGTCLACGKEGRCPSSAPVQIHGQGFPELPYRSDVAGESPNNHHCGTEQCRQDRAPALSEVAS